MIILGIDPGYGRCGWAILAKQGKSEIRNPKSEIPIEFYSIEDPRISFGTNSNIQNSKIIKSYKPCLPAGRLQATSLIACDCIETDAKKDLPDRLKEIYQAVGYLIKKYQPQELAIEELFFFKNQKTAMAVAQARGVIIVAAKNLGLDIYEYTPLQVKQAVVGYGQATKEQVQKMIKFHLQGQNMPIQDDTVDAIAIAITHINAYGNTKYTQYKNV